MRSERQSHVLRATHHIVGVFDFITSPMSPFRSPIETDVTQQTKTSVHISTFNSFTSSWRTKRSAMKAYLMREAIVGHQGSSGVIRGHQKRSAMKAYPTIA